MDGVEGSAALEREAGLQVFAFEPDVVPEAKGQATDAGQGRLPGHVVDTGPQYPFDIAFRHRLLFIDCAHSEILPQPTASAMILRRLFFARGAHQ